MSVRIFISTVSDEFRLYRDQLDADLRRQNVGAIVQEEFKAHGGATLDKLDDYIKPCDVVIHLVGDMTGEPALAPSIQAIREKYPDLTKRFPRLAEALDEGIPISYTQWEAWLALYHDKVLLIAKADDSAPRGPSYTPTDASRAAQQEHLARLAAVERFPEITFTSPDNLAKQIAYTTILDLLAESRTKTPPRQPRNLPFASLGSLFKGRDAFLDKLHEALTKSQDTHVAAVTGKALHGLGGIGKTRLAIEYALEHESEYSALLFVPAETPERLVAGLAALAGPEILDLPEKDAREDAVKIPAALGWLEQHPGWLMILDNVDDEIAAAAVEELVSRLKGGHVLITGRTGDFSGAIETFPLDVLSEDDAASLLLDATKKREKTPNDSALAHELAGELGGLALALAQASAYIDRQRTSFARYLKLWRETRETVLNWFDKRLVSYNHDVGLAATWVASVEKLTPPGRRLLELCAFLDPAPVPKFLLDVPLPSSASFDAHGALADLFAYSLASHVDALDGKAAEAGFAVHRLVQDFTLRRLDKTKRKQLLAEALCWVNAALVGDPGDVGCWRVLDPLTPHALALTQRGYEAGIPEPTARIMAVLGVLYQIKSRYAEAEPLLRLALAIHEASLRPDHPEVAIRLNNLAQLLQATNRLGEAEAMYWRALSIDYGTYGLNHPNIARDLSNLAVLLQATGRFAKAEPMYQQALAIDVESFGPGHPNVAIRLNNLAGLLKATHCFAEAEALYRRALAIIEASDGPKNYKVAFVLDNLAQLLQATDRLEEAEEMYRKALAIDEASYGPDHLNVAICLNNLAMLLHATNRLAEAGPLMRRALAIFEASYGPDHPQTVTIRANLASLGSPSGTP